jgi:AraC-like DNA-binding protein
MPYSHLATATNVLWKLIEAHDHDPAALFRRAGIDPNLLQMPGARIRSGPVNQAWRMASEIIDDPCFGLLGAKFWHPSYMHALGYAWLASHSLRDAFNRFVRYLHIVSEAASVTLKDVSDRYTVIIDANTAGLRVQAQIDLTMAVLHHICRLNFGEDLYPMSVSFIHPPPACPERYREIFKSPVYFSAAEDSITFSLADVDRHLPGANAVLARVNDQLMIDYLAKLDSENIIQRVKAAIIDNLPSGEVSHDKVAPAVNMSARSLQRKLKDQGTSFRSLLDETRRDLADSYIRDMETDLTEIAFLLGFSEHSAFSRAFKRWTGKSPKASREAMAQTK